MDKVKKKKVLPDPRGCTTGKLNSAFRVCFYITTNSQVVYRQTMQHHHKLHCGPLQNLYLSFLMWRINQRLSALSLSLPLCSWGGAGVRGHRGAYGVLGESWPARLGLWRKAWVDLHQQPGRRADPARPPGGLKAAHTQTHSPAVWRFREEGLDERQWWNNITEEGRGPAMW